MSDSPRIFRRRLTSTFVVLLGLATFGTVLGAAATDATTASAASRGSLRGVLLPYQSRQLPARAAGVIKKFGAAEGQQVNVGDVLVQLNAEVEKAEVARAEAVLENANAEFDRTKREFERTSKLRSESIGSQKDLEDAQFMNVLANGRRKQAAAELEIAKARLHDRSIVAPIAGLIFRRTREVGESVERMETILRLVDASKLELVVYAGVELMGKFKTGQQARLLVESGPGTGTQAVGTVSYIDPTLDPETITYRVKIELAPGEGIQPGISVVLQLPSEVN